MWYDVELYADELERKRARHALRQVVNVQLDLVRHGRWAEKFSRPLPLCSPAVPLVPLLLYSYTKGNYRMLSSTLDSLTAPPLQGFPGSGMVMGPYAALHFAHVLCTRPVYSYLPLPVTCMYSTGISPCNTCILYAAAEATVLYIFRLLQECCCKNAPRPCGEAGRSFAGPSNRFLRNTHTYRSAKNPTRSCYWRWLHSRCSQRR